MSELRNRRYFIVKHGLDAFEALPGFIWRTGMPSTKVPPKFNQVNIGDRWIEFAYIKDEVNCKHCSLITGFYECTREAWYGLIPRDRANQDEFDGWYWDENACMIEGKPYGEQPLHKPVSVPPINEILDRRVFGQGAIIPGFSRKDFVRIRDETLKRQLNSKKIPLMRREPLNEQELLSVVVDGYKKLGIEKIIEVQCRFPDMLVSINGKEVYLELEIDSLGFRHHWDDLRRIPKCRSMRDAKLKDKDDNRPVAILCWVDGDKDRELRKSVRHLKVYEVQSLLRKGNIIV